mgnify:CR=1 FL=1
MTTQVEMKKYKSIQEKEKVCAEMEGNQFPYQKEMPLKYPKVRNEQEQKGEGTSP